MKKTFKEHTKDGQRAMGDFYSGKIDGIFGPLSEHGIELMAKENATLHSDVAALEEQNEILRDKLRSNCFTRLFK